MTKILVNKNGIESNIENVQQPIDVKNLTNDYTKKIDNSITELVSEDPTLYFEKEEELSNDDKINQFLVEYGNIKLIMTGQQLFDFYTLVKGDVPIELIDEKIKNDILEIKHSQGILITNKNYKINGRQIPYLKNENFNDPFTVTTWIKPNSKNFNRKTLIRNQLIFTVEGEIIKR